jgi:glycerophosphoryl diester phosphodiesterase
MSLAGHLRQLGLVGAVAMLLPPSAARAQPQDKVKVCIAHAGASARAPEHTLAAYRMAIEMKADYIEQDLQLTKDGVLVCIHDASLERTTNVEDVFPARYRVLDQDGKQRKTWPVVDFTLDEVKRLDAGSWFDPKYKNERVPTFQESIDLAREKTGIYPELKKSEFISQGGPDIVAATHERLVANGLNSKTAQRATPVVIQSFHPQMLKELRNLSNDAYPLIQLIWFTQVNEMLTDEGLDAISRYAQGIGPVASMISADRTRVTAARQRGLLVHVWMLDKQLPEPFKDSRQYYTFLLDDLGVDGVFCDEPDQFPAR